MVMPIFVLIKLFSCKIIKSIYSTYLRKSVFIDKLHNDHCSTIGIVVDSHCFSGVVS